MQLTDAQLDAIQAIVSPFPASMAFRGPAGCGKTTVLQHAASRLPLAQTLFIAPTNKALEVFSSKLPSGAECKTLAQVIGKVRAKVNGEEVFVIKDSLRSRLMRRYKEDEIKYFIVDEASMIGQVDADLLEEMADYCNAKIVWSGDKYQLPPVGDRPCSQFYESEHSVELTEVLRHGGPVLDYATNIRSSFQVKHFFPTANSFASESSIQIKPRDEWFNDFCERLEKGDLSTRALCWTNANVSSLSTKSRIAVYGEQSKYGWLPGETVMIHSHHTTPSGVRLLTSFEYEVIKSERQYLAFDKGELKYVTPVKKENNVLPLVVAGGFQVITAIRVFFDGTRSDYKVKIYCPTPDSEAKNQLKHIQKSLSDFKRKKYIIGQEHLEEVEGKIAQIKSYFAPLRSAQVMTVHKSQGSTFQNVFICNDLMACEKPERNNLLYVASTRASQSAVFSTFA
jgi:exodeoxyribonuclease-5